MNQPLPNHSTEPPPRFDLDLRLASKPIIEEQARRQVRTFLDELKNGTRNYRTVASLGSQVAQEYRGRAILELLQNAHDVLAFAGQDDPRQISFVLRSSPEPELLVANSGRPFRHEDFSGICQLAQSPKDPNESVGNKGLGFQSVLEVSTRPEVWSTAPARDGIAFTFGFDPDVREPVERVARALLTGDPPTDPEFGTEPVVDWSLEQIEAYRRRLEEDGINPVAEVRDYLSPYVIPRFLGDPPPEVARLLEHGHVTVIRLPLDGGRAGSAEEAVESVRKQLEDLDEAAVVFLPDLSVLRIEIDEKPVELRRRVEARRTLPAPREEPDDGKIPRARHTRLRVGRIEPDATTERSFHVWSRSLGGDDQPEVTERIAAAVRHLPNRWPEVEKVEVSVSVEETREPGQGVFVIFLPTEMETGVGAHINAPFYGSLDRRHIDFGEQYNDLLLSFVTDLMLDAVEELANGDPEEWRGRAVIDLVAKVTEAKALGSAPPLTDRLRQQALDKERPLEELALILCDEGWQLPGVARTMPAVPNEDPIGRTEWRGRAGFNVASSALDDRRNAVEALLRSLGGSPSPRTEEWAKTLGLVAEHVSQDNVKVTWHEFLNSVLAVIPPSLRQAPTAADADPLLQARFLPTDDDRLLAASDDTQIFFRPRRDADDAADFVGSIPDPLTDRIAFLHPEVRTLEGRPQRNTEVQKFLDGRFVQSFRREDLLRNVVIPSLPELPAEHESPEAKACAETLDWTLKLIGEEEQDTLLPLLGRLPVACIGGWFAMRDAVFGPGWLGRRGEHLKTLADGLPEDEGERLLRTALLPPDDSKWNGIEIQDPGTGTIGVAERGAMFAQIGVAEGFRLEKHDPPMRFWMDRSHRDLPDEAPPGIPQSSWDDWRDSVRHEIDLGYVMWFEYEINDVSLFPVRDLLHREDLGGAARSALTELTLASIARWEEGWDQVTIRKKTGSPWSQRITSPLAHWISTLPWLDDRPDDADPWHLDPQPLRHRWLVPAFRLEGQKGRFRHLAPLSGEAPLKLAYRLGEDEELVRTLKELGLNTYPTGNESARTGPSLLNALAEVAAKGPGAMPAGGFDVFLGQFRHAWGHLDPDRGLPERFVVHTGPRTLEVRTTAELKDVYLPDHSANTRLLAEHGRPIIAMWPKEANAEIGDRLHELGIRRASDLEADCLVDGLPANDATHEACSLDAAGLGWLRVVLLTLAAYGGPNPSGPATDAWRAAAARLKRVRITRCNSISVELRDAERTVANSEPKAHWMARDNILLLTREVVATGSYGEIGTACQSVLDRRNLLKDLRLVLDSLDGELRPTPARIDEALDRAEIDAGAVADIRLQIGNPLDRIRPVAQLLRVSADDLEAAATGADRLYGWLSDNIPRWPTEDLMAAAHECYDDFEMGFRAWRVLGDDAGLPKWNEALAALGGEYRPVENEHATDQTARYMMMAAPALRAFARHVANESPGVLDPARLFSDVRAVHEGLVMHPGWKRNWWTVPFRAVLGTLRDRYEEIKEVQEHLGAFADADTFEQFVEALIRQGVALEPDPLDDARRNERRVSRVFRGMWSVYQAWLAKQDRDRGCIEQAPPVDVDATRYLSEWSEDDAFELAKGLIDDEGFVNATSGCTTIDAMRERLGISPEEVEDPTPPPDGRDPVDPVTIGEGEFVFGVDSYRDLFERLDRLEIGRALFLTGQDPSGPNDPLASVTSEATTTAPAVVRGRPETPPPNDRAPVGPSKRGPIAHSPSHLRELVGIVGEMHAYRYLKAAFGIDENGWVAQFRTKVFPVGSGEKDTTDDRLGYDFEFPHPDGKVWCVEVKSTTGDGTSFDVTAGEIAAARRLAESKEKRWLFLRVRHAFSSRPEFDWLPNPFEPAGRFLQLRVGSMKVDYERAKER